MVSPEFTEAYNKAKEVFTMAKENPSKINGIIEGMMGLMVAAAEVSAKSPEETKLALELREEYLNLHTFPTNSSAPQPIQHSLDVVA